MEERVTKCLETIGKAIKELILSANNDVEVIGLSTLFAVGFQETYNKAIDEAVDELQKKEEEDNSNGI